MSFSICDMCQSNTHGTITSSKHDTLCVRCFMGRGSMYAVWRQAEEHGLYRIVRSRILFIRTKTNFIQHLKETT